MTTTLATSLVIAAVFGALAGWLVVVVANALDLVAPYVPWTAPAALVVIAALVGALAWSTHQRLQVRKERMPPGAGGGLPGARQGVGAGRRRDRRWLPGLRPDVRGPSSTRPPRGSA